ncbi:HD-GYP domain-containing protein [Paenibacillus thermotolerans]|uniref:HD-GYP domain-containing protein n=1 Tax=Paenibacillus thermotolerans TaxID=3027807 RepID=UPI002367CB51|nr:MULTISPECIES: HD-GYP domain-containing protein [unclassified Paenibacillus]
MRLIPTARCLPGMKLGRPIYTAEGHVLVGYRVELTHHIISRLQQLGYEYVYVEDPLTEDIFIEDSIRVEIALVNTMRKICNLVSTAPSSLSEGTLSLSRHCHDSIMMAIRDLANRHDDWIMMTDHPIQPGGRNVDMFIQNSVNVCVYATKLGMIEGYKGDDLYTLSLGALLHDIGNLRIPAELLHKPGPLTAEEFREVQTHTLQGFQLLKAEPGILFAASQCALQHHERVDGSGYPFGLKGSAIHPFARLVGIADAYVALTHSRCYRKQPFLPHEALDMLYANTGTFFDKEKVELFRNKVAVFPVGVSVSLNTGEQGIVSKVNPMCKHRPVVRILRNRYGLELQKPFEIDLSQKLSVMINRVGEELAAAPLF